MAFVSSSDRRRWVGEWGVVARAVLGLGVGALVGSACDDPGFTCSDDDACVRDGGDGTCETTGFCSFPDAACPSGRRYGERVGDGLAGTCVAAGTTDAGSSEAGSDGGDTLSSPGQHYGTCATASDCEDADAACVTNGVAHMCAPSCTVEALPSAECPARVDGDTASIGCLYTDDTKTTLRCFIGCAVDGDCPAGMACAQPVCTWPS